MFPVGGQLFLDPAAGLAQIYFFKRTEACRLPLTLCRVNVNFVNSQANVVCMLNNKLAGYFSAKLPALWAIVNGHSSID